MRRFFALAIPSTSGWSSSSSPFLPTTTHADTAPLPMNQLYHYFVESCVRLVNMKRSGHGKKINATAVPVPRSSPEAAVKNIAKDMFGNPFEYKTASSSNATGSDSVDGGGTGGIFTGLNIDTLPLGIVIPWCDVQRQLQIFVSGALTDPKSASRGRTFLRDFDVLSNITTIDEGIELLYYLQRLSYPADSRVERNLIDWFTDNVACFTVQHVTDICRYALEQSANKAPLFWRKKILLTDWFVGHLQTLVEADPNFNVLVLMESQNDDVDTPETEAVNRTSKNKIDKPAHIPLSVKSPGAVCTIDDCVLIARVLNFTAAGECSRVGDGGNRKHYGRSGNGRKGSGSVNDKQDDNVGISANIVNSATFAAIDIEDTKRRSILQALVAKTNLIIEFEMECATRYDGNATDSLSEEGVASGDYEGDFFATENNKVNNGIGVVRIPQEYILTPEKIANVVMHIAPVERSGATEAMINFLTPMFTKAKSTDALRLLTAMSDIGVCNPQLLGALCSGITKRLMTGTLDKSGANETADERVTFLTSEKGDKVKFQKTNKKNKLNVNLKQLKKMEQEACSRDEKKEIDDAFNVIVDMSYASKALELIKLITATEIRSVIHAIDIIKSNKKASSSSTVASGTNNISDVVVNDAKFPHGSRSDADGSVESNTISSDAINSVISPLAEECLRVLSSLVEAIATSTKQEVSRVFKIKGHSTMSTTNKKGGKKALKGHQENDNEEGFSERSSTTVESDDNKLNRDNLLTALCEVSDAVNVGHIVLLSKVAELLPGDSTPGGQLANKAHSRTQLKKIGREEKKSNINGIYNSEVSPSSAIATIRYSCNVINKALVGVVHYVLARDPVDLESFGACLRIASRLQGDDTILYTMLSNACENISQKFNEQSFIRLSNQDYKESALGDLSLSFEAAVSIAEGLSAFQCFPPTLVEVCVRRALENRSLLTSHNIACLIYIAGCSRGAALDVEIYHQLTSRLINTSKFTSRTSGISTSSSAISSITSSGTLSPNSVGMLLKGLASADIKPDEMLQQYLGQQPLLFANDFSGKDCTALLTVVHQLKLESSPLGQRLGSEIAEAIPRMIPDDLVLVASTMAHLNLRDIRLFDQIGSRLRDLGPIVSSSHLTAFAAALRETNFASVFTRCNLDTVVRSLSFLSPNDATYLTAFCSPPTQDYLLSTFIKSKNDLKQLSVESLLTVYSTEGRASDSIQSDALLLLEGKVAPITLPADVASLALCRAIRSSNNSAEEMMCVAHLIDFMAPVSHKFLQSQVSLLLETIRDCIAKSVTPEQLAKNIEEEKQRIGTTYYGGGHGSSNDEGSVTFIDPNDIASSTNTLKGGTFKVPVPVFRFLGRRLVAVSESLSIDQCLMALEIYSHGNVRDDRVVKLVFKRLTKHTRIIVTSPRLSLVCMRLCDFFGNGWTHGLNVSLKVKAAKTNSVKKF